MVIRYTMRFKTWEIELSQQEGMLAACCRNLNSKADDWQSPLRETARKLWWVVDRYFLWELEIFPSRRCPEREQFRAQFMELGKRLEVTQ